MNTAEAFCSSREHALQGLQCGTRVLRRDRPAHDRTRRSGRTAPFGLTGGGPARYRRCRNYSDHYACNWLVSAGDDEPYCRSCRLTEIVPDLSDPANKAAWVEVEGAKRRLLYTLYALRLPVVSKRDDEDAGLTFRFMHATPEQPVTTGHERGIITLNMAEANGAFRENMREKLGEGYRTVLGHLRHEIGHYYWDRLIQSGPELDAYRELFGDERQDYPSRLSSVITPPAPRSDWADSFISAYATMHPWEDWAESWAHYLHMVDTLETAKSHGLTVRVPGQIRGTCLDGLPRARRFGHPGVALARGDPGVEQLESQHGHKGIISVRALHLPCCRSSHSSIASSRVAQPLGRTGPSLTRRPVSLHLKEDR